MSRIIPLAAPFEPPVNLPGGNRPQLQPQPGVCLVRAEAAVPQHHLHHLEVARRRLPLTDLDRHDLDPCDTTFASLAPGYAEAVEWSNRYVAERNAAAVTL